MPHVASLLQARRQGFFATETGFRRVLTVSGAVCRRPWRRHTEIDDTAEEFLQFRQPSAAELAAVSPWQRPRTVLLLPPDDEHGAVVTVHQWTSLTRVIRPWTKTYSEMNIEYDSYSVGAPSRRLPVGYIYYWDADDQGRQPSRNCTSIVSQHPL